MINSLLTSINQVISTAINTAVSVSRLDSLVGQQMNSFCASISGTSKPVIVDARKVLSPSSLPVGSGVLTFSANGTAAYTCPPAGPAFRQSETFTARKTLCDGTGVSNAVTLVCATSQVTITMGDNGSANDDIFVVQINGRTVLTSSVPVRSTSTTVSLPRGRTTVQMIGLAAPDGIGTYFIRFTGASVVSGDPLSGTDLTPGRSKTFVIEVL